MCEKETLEELKKLKHSFEMVVNDDSDDNQEVGTFGAMLIYFLWKSGIMDFILSNYNFKNRL